MLVELKNAVFGYGMRPVVRVDDLRIDTGRCLGIFGPNGAGKTTLIRGMTGLLPPLAGTVVQHPPSLSMTGDPPVKNSTTTLRIGYLPQHRAMELHWPMSGFDAAAMATSARTPFGWLGGRDSKSVLAMMQTLGVDDLAHRPFSRLSGGQQQRLLLAGALAADPHLLVLDEPTDGLDVQSTRKLLELLRDFLARGLSCVIISHEVEDLLFLAEDVAWLHAAEAFGEASHVEMITPEGLAQRMLGARAGGRGS
jgi:ABC-type Mn2+/Zn2+ transport system ATPase subunit